MPIIIKIKTITVAYRTRTLGTPEFIIIDGQINTVRISGLSDIENYLEKIGVWGGAIVYIVSTRVIAANLTMFSNSVLVSYIQQTDLRALSTKTP